MSEENNLFEGYRAMKVGGSYEAAGTIVSRFKTRSGAWRYVFEFDSPPGLLHIFSGRQLMRIDDQ